MPPRGAQDGQAGDDRCGARHHHPVAGGGDLQPLLPPGPGPGSEHEHLKRIEQNIRQFSYKMTSQEEFNAQRSKVVTRRMATLEALAEQCSGGPRAPATRPTSRGWPRRTLTAMLYQHPGRTLRRPASTGSTSMIVELAVAIATNLPMESRDVAITYPLPEQPVQPNIMEVEKTGLPVLDTRADDDEGADDKDASKDGKKSRSGTRLRRALPPRALLTYAPPPQLHLPLHPRRTRGKGDAVRRLRGSRG